MDSAELLDYALGRLDAGRREQIERELARHPTLAGRMARAIRNLGRLLDDGRERQPRESDLSLRSTLAPPNSDPLIDDDRPNGERGGGGEARGSAASS